MHIYNLRELIEFDDEKVFPKILINRPGYRLILLNLRRGQSVPEHATQETVTVYAVHGNITFYGGQTPYDLRAGEVLSIEGGVPHQLTAHEDSSLLVVAAGGNAATPGNPVLDLREVPRPQRHPLVFARLDALGVGEAFELINDHDPIPLHRQIDAMRPGQTEWSYIERKPEFFHIRVRRVAVPGDSETGPPVRADVLLDIQRT